MQRKDLLAIVAMLLLAGCATQSPVSRFEVPASPVSDGPTSNPNADAASPPRTSETPRPTVSTVPTTTPATPNGSPDPSETREYHWSDARPIWPRECPPNTVPATTGKAAPTTLKRCIGPQAFAVDGRSLAFTDNYTLDSVRPGMNSASCSTAFMVTDEAENLYLTLSGHCFNVGGADPDGDFCTATYRPIGSPRALEGYDEPGTLAWSSGQHMQQYGGTPEECSSWDVAFLKIPETLRNRTHPAIKHIGGPTGLRDPLTIKYGNATYGYGQSIVRSLAYETVTGEDMGNNPMLAPLNMFSGYFAGDQLDDYYCRAPSVFGCVWNTTPYNRGLEGMIRYPYGKTEGDSGSSDLMENGDALGVTAALNILSGTTVTSFLYDTFVRIWFDTGQRYALVTWNEWSPTTVEQ